MSATIISSTNFQSILNAALDSYAKQTGIDLSKHPSSSKIQNCATPEDVLQLLQDRETAFKDYRDKHRKLINRLRPVVRVIHAFSGVLGEVAGLVPFQPAKAIFVGVDVLLSAAVGVSASYDALFDLFDCVGNFLERLHIYTEKIPPVPAISNILIKIMAEVLGVLSVATKQIKQGRFAKFAKKLLGECEIEAILQRLDRLTHEEARVTAAHTLEVVYGLVNNLKIVVGDGEASSEGIQRTLVEIQEMADEINKMKRDQLQEKIRNWLRQPDPSTNHNIALRQRHDGTALWFTKGCTFKDWRNMGSLLWIHGKPGSGKSVICSSIIQEIESLHDMGLALMTYFYCDFKDKKKQDVTGVLTSLMAQFSAKSDPCYNILAALYSKYDAGSRQPDEDALTECLKNMLQIEGQPPIYIIVDAIDECPNSIDIVSPRDRVLVLVENLVTLHLPSLRICVTSRPEADIRVSLESLASHTISLHDQSGQKNDIADYVGYVVRSDRNMRKWRTEDKELVIETLSQKADGMFRWIVCQLVMLRRCIPATIRRALDDLPRSLDETYERILLSIGEERWEYAQRLFRCLAVSFRPLRVDELAEILAIQFDAGTLPNYDETLRPEDSEEAVLSTCSSLITIVNVDGSPVAQFSHFSVKEYLTSERLANAGKELSRYHILPESSHIVLAQASLSILLTLDDQVDKNRMKEFPLAVYAAQHWVGHAQVENVSSNVEDAMKCLFDSKSHFATWVWIYDIDYPFRLVFFADEPTPPEAPPLYYATLCGFRGIVEWLVKTCPQDVNAKGGYYSTPLHAALAKGNLEVAQVLLEHHVDVTAPNDDNLTPLHWASKGGRVDCVDLLLKYQTDINIQNNEGQSPLHVASEYGRLDVARLLLRSGAAVDVRDKLDFTPLMIASRYGHLDVVRLLRQRHAAVETYDTDGWNPLLLALRCGHLDVVHFLLENGAAASVDFRGNDGWTPLKLASDYGYLDTARLLIQSGAPVNSYGKSGLTTCGDVNVQDMVQVGSTPLHHASTRGYLDIVELLIEHGADCGKRNEHEETPLDLASKFGKLEVARLLLKSGSNPNLQNSEGWTPLHKASRHGHLQIVRLLFESGADVNTRNGDNETAFDVASGSGWREVARYLAECMGRMDFEDAAEMTELNTAQQDAAFPDAARSKVDGEESARTERDEDISLHTASREGYLVAVRSLLDSGAEVNKLDTSHRTPLDWASTEGRFEVTKLLIEHGANVNCRNKSGWTPLHGASRFGYLDVARMLLDNGADVNATTQVKWTSLHVASWEGCLNIVQLLLERGADVHALNDEGLTAYSLASMQTEQDIKQLLLKYGALAV